MQHRKPHPASKPVQSELFPGRACPFEAKPATERCEAVNRTFCRDGVQSGGTRRRNTEITGETLSGLSGNNTGSRKAYKGNTRKCGYEVGQGVGDGHSTGERRENRREGRTVASAMRTEQGKAAGLSPKGKTQSRQKSGRRTLPERMDKARKLQRTLYRAAMSQPERRFTLLYDKICCPDILREAWRRVRNNGGSAGIDRTDTGTIQDYGEERFLKEIREELITETYRVSAVMRVRIPKPGKPGQTRPPGIPTIKDRVVQMAVKTVIEPMSEADFIPCSYGFRPKRTQRMASADIVRNINAGYRHIADVDIRSYFDSIDHEKLMKLVERRVGDIRILRLIRAWLKAGVAEEGRITHPIKGTPQGGVISPLLSDIFLHEIDRQWHKSTGESVGNVRLVRYADDMVLMAKTEQEAEAAWELLQRQFAELSLTVNEEKSRLTTAEEGFRFLGFEFRMKHGRLYMWACAKAVSHFGERLRQTVRSVSSTGSLKEVIKKLNPVLIGWCTYFRIGNSNRVFHKTDWQTRSEIQRWLRRKYRLSMRQAMKRWNYRVLHEYHGLYRMVGKVSHLEGLRRTLTEEGSRRAVYGKTVCTVR